MPILLHTILQAEAGKWFDGQTDELTLPVLRWPPWTQLAIIPETRDNYTAPSQAALPRRGGGERGAAVIPLV